MEFYGLDGQLITITEWQRLTESGERVIAQTVLPGGCWVSTVLLGIDHNWTGEGPPIIFESMVFESQENMIDLDCVRYATREQAEAGHAALVTRWTGWTPGDPNPPDAEASFLTQFINALGAQHPDQMVVMHPKDADVGGEPYPPEGAVW